MIRPLIGATVAVALTGTFAGCLVGDADGEAVEDASFAAKASDAEIAANCSVNNPKKEAVCHIPPGNPANAHTICISKAAVQTHLSKHGDYLGACQPSNGSGGSNGQGGGGNSSTGAGGSNTTSGSGGSTGSAGECIGGMSCNTTADCDAGASCLNGCCVILPN